MPNRWILFVKDWSKKNNMSYGCALSDPKLKIDYRNLYPTKPQEKTNEYINIEKMRMEDRDAPDDITEWENKVAELSKELDKDVRTKDLIKIKDSILILRKKYETIKHNVKKTALYNDLSHKFNIKNKIRFQK